MKREEFDGAHSEVIEADALATLGGWLPSTVAAQPDPDARPIGVAFVGGEALNDRGEPCRDGEPVAVWRARYVTAEE